MNKEEQAKEYANSLWNYPRKSIEQVSVENRTRIYNSTKDFIAGYEAKEAEDKWISVDEISMYPEQEIIVYFKNEAGWHTTAAYWDTKNIVNFCEVCGNQDIWGRSILVKFFMPLPSPPKQ